MSDYKYGCIYMTTNLINNKIYIGKRQRWKEVENGTYKGSGRLITKAFLKYGWENFQTKIICYCKNIKELNKMEEYFIEQMNSVYIHGNGYNISTGGDGGDVMKNASIEEKIAYRKKLSQALTGITRSKETRQKMSIARMRENLSEETLRKLSESSKGKPKSLAHRQSLSNVRRNKKLSEQHKKNIGESLKGKAQPKVICTYCDRVGGITGMKRYHFDNCKLKQSLLSNNT